VAGYAPVKRVLRSLAGGSAGNEQLTAIVACVLLVLLAVEGATLLNLNALLTVHGFVGMLLLPVVGLKLASTAWRFARYYLHAEEYVRRGPPHIALRVVVAPVIVVSTIVLFGTGVALLALDRTQGTLVGLHKASFIVWFGATSLHVLAHLVRLRRVLGVRLPGLSVRLAVVGAAVLAGVAVATLTLPGADRLQDRATSAVGLDRR
jgi:hypothetical protein